MDSNGREDMAINRKPKQLLALAASLAILSLSLPSQASDKPDYWPEVMSAWKGREAIELWRSWGIPTRIVTAPNGNEMHSYISTSNNPSKTWSTKPKTEKPNTALDYSKLRCEAIFEVDDKKTIVSVQWRGSQCPESEEDTADPNWMLLPWIGF